MDSSFRSELTMSNNGFLFDHNTGLTYTLNPTGQYIFRNLQKGKLAAEILKGIMSEFEIDEATARKDLDDFFRQLKEMGLTD